MPLVYFFTRLVLIMLPVILLLIQIFTPPILKAVELLDFFKPPLVWAESQPQSRRLLFADDFEHGLDQWEAARGSLDQWQVAADGWLEANLQRSYTISELVPKDEFWDSEQRNYQFEFQYQVLSAADRNWAWGYEDEQNWYELHTYRGRQHLLRLKDNHTVFYHTNTFNVQTGQIYHVKIVFNQGLIQVWVDGDLIIERQDHSYEDSGGKIALKATTGAAYPTQVRFNQVRVYELEPSENVNLHLTEFKQYDEPWRNQEYNHALSWPRWGDWRSRPPPYNQPPERTTIYHWGCAMTSLAMIMDYYNLNQLPDGTELNPGTLNAWLNKQADGYLGEGSLNWLAGSRLSRLIREQHSLPGQELPVLEFHRSYTPSIETVIEEIDDLQPVILQIPGHFLTATGYPPAQDDLLISDPAYTYQNFSRHNQPLISSITYQPTQTDLSYLMLIYDPHLTVELLNQDLEAIEQVFYAQDTLADQFYDHQSCWLNYDEAEANQHCFAHVSAPVIQYLAQPDNGVYQLEVKLDKDDGKQLLPWQIFAYDKQGEVKMIDRIMVLPEENFVLDFDKTELAHLSIQSSQTYNFANFSDQLTAAYQQQLIGLYPFLRLQEAANWALTTKNCLEPAVQDRYAQLILQLMVTLVELEQIEQGLPINLTAALFDS